MPWKGPHPHPKGEAPYSPKAPWTYKASWILNPTNGPRQGNEEIYIQGVSGAIVGNPDTIHDEVTTQAFSGAIVGKCSQNLLNTIIWLKQKMHLNYGIVQARVVISSHDSINILPIMRTTDNSSFKMLTNVSYVFLHYL